jgi:carboxylesterase
MPLNGSTAAFDATRPYLLQGGSTGILIIHGFTGVPGELRPLGDFLAQSGYTVAGGLLARHDGHPETLRGVRWSEWYESVEQVWQELQRRCERVMVIGFSLGGLLALHLAARRPIDGVITVAAALDIAGGWQLRALPVARYIMRWYYPMRTADFSDPELRSRLMLKMGKLDFDDPAIVAQLRTGIRIPTGAIHEICRLSRRVQRELPHINVPTLVLQGRLDQVVLPVSAERIMARLGSVDKQLVWFDQSGHQLLRDVEHQRVQQTIKTWLAKRVAVQADSQQTVKT